MRSVLTIMLMMLGTAGIAGCPELTEISGGASSGAVLPGGGASSGGGGVNSGGGAPPAAPIFPDPGDGEPNVPLQLDALGNRSIVDLEWWGPVGATRYVVEISRSRSFPASSTERWGTSSDSMRFAITSPQYRRGTTYYWRVTVYNDFGSTTGATWSFTTES